MATPPRIDDGELAAVLNRIHSRHRKIDDPHLDRWEHEPRAALDYLIRYSDVSSDTVRPGRARSIPRWVAQADTYDALTLIAWLWWDDRRRERSILRRGLDLGLDASQLGSPLGITSRQGLFDRVGRLDALLETGRPDEKHTRAARSAKRRAAAARETTETWLATHREEIAALAHELLDAAETLAIADRDFCDELAADPFLTSDDPAVTASPSILALLGLAVGELRAAPEVLALPSVHPVHRLVRRAEAARAAAEHA